MRIVDVRFCIPAKTMTQALSAPFACYVFSFLYSDMLFTGSLLLLAFTF